MIGWWDIDVGGLSFMYLLFFFNDTATTEIYTLSLHDALPIFHCERTDAGSVKQFSDMIRA